MNSCWWSAGTSHFHPPALLLLRGKEICKNKVAIWCWWWWWWWGYHSLQWKIRILSWWFSTIYMTTGNSLSTSISKQKGKRKKLDMDKMPRPDSELVIISNSIRCKWYNLRKNINILEFYVHLFQNCIIFYFSYNLASKKWNTKNEK